jgi:integrase
MPATDYVDTLIAEGLYERVYSSGTIVHRSLVTTNGKKVLETFRGLNRTQAKAKHIERRDQGNKGELRHAENVTLGQLRELAFTHYQGLIDLEGANGQRPPVNRASLANYRSAWPKRISAYRVGNRSLDDVRLDDLDEKVIRGWFVWLAQQSVAPSTQNGTLSALRCALRFGRESRLMRHDPVRDLPTNERPSQKPRKGWKARVFSKSELTRVLEAATSDPFLAATETVFTHAIVVFAKTGLRLSELAGLRWRDVDLVEGVLNVVQQRERAKAAEPVALTDLKSANSERELPLGPHTLAAFIAQLDLEQAKGRGGEDDFVFTDFFGQPVTVEHLKSATRRATRIAGLGEHGPQVLRRSFATQLAHANIASVEGADMMGHGPDVFDGNYAKPLRVTEQRKANVARLAESGFEL